MKIELKNIHYSPHLSDETNAFTADVLVDGQNVGHAKNDGNGGETYVGVQYSKNDAILKRNHELLRKAEEYAASLPPDTWDFNGKQYTRENDLTNIVDGLLDAYLKEKEEKKWRKKTDRAFVSKSDGMWRYTSFKLPVAELIVMFPDQMKKNFDEFKASLKPGEVIYNENLPKEWL